MRPLDQPHLRLHAVPPLLRLQNVPVLLAHLFPDARISSATSSTKFRRTHHRDAQVRVVGTADDERLSWGMEDGRALNAELLGHLGGRVDEHRGVVQLERALSFQEGCHGFLRAWMVSEGVP